MVDAVNNLSQLVKESQDEKQDEKRRKNFYCDATKN